MSLLELPWKQNGHPVDCIVFLVFISPPKCGHWHLWRLTCGLLPMAKLCEPLMGVRDTSKLGNWKLAKSRILLIIIINVDRMLILGLSWKQKDLPIGCITFLILISFWKCGVQRLRRLIYGLLSMAKLAQLLMDVKDTTKYQTIRKWQNR